MGFVAEVLNNISGIKYLYITGLLIFLALFFVVLYRTIRIPKQDLMNYKTSILEDHELESNENVK